MTPLPIQIGNYLYQHAYPVYKPLYFAFKRWQDRYELQRINQIVKPGQNIIDIGANIGFYSLVFSKLTGPSGSVLSLEPDPANFRHLQDNAGTYTNITLIKGAAGHETEKAELYFSNKLNVDHRTYEHEDYTFTEQISMYRIDDLITESQQVDFIKIDIQGFEMKAFSGMSELLRRNQQIQMITEFWPYGLSVAGSSGYEMIEYLLDTGFQLYVLSNRRWKPINEIPSELLYKVCPDTYYNIHASRHKVL